MYLFNFNLHGRIDFLFTLEHMKTRKGLDKGVEVTRVI